ncbi:6-phosphogluconate dehydrogenase, NAD(+)-dependent, decarboxylating [Meiothermus luteus]|jgi:6-phosphogluconate dehydrogenase|uniref:6-phosphogluconate dehydrogenase, NAD(+)-dependent, decarboxylating n=1 Tax=Meiothermus luteus TaxID=2026184 RepID=A0A399EH16_9DEIN|nr:decarboxylating 6-phosphogluconate dehydrogenase [Meiothermus luteus]RIH82853.1 6-phosphogluconate dehydrogenase, NAD(+)-dependent, decarboxylating [Meiothermus luteus]
MQEIGMVGLGRMGGAMARRLQRKGFQVVGFDQNPQAARAAELVAADTLEHLVSLLSPPRLVWLMLPAGEATEKTLEALAILLAPGDLLVDGGNAYYKDSQRRAAWLAERGLLFADVGVSGGVWGLEEGYGLMVGGPAEVASRLRPFLEALAPSPDSGWVHVGPVGAGHFAKMVHNGIEYGMMQALAEGLHLLQKKREFQIDLAALTQAWRHGTVIRSWLLDLVAQGLAEDPELKEIAPVVADSGEGRWTVQEAVELGVGVPVIAQALFSRFESQDKEGYDRRLLALMRRMFGGHAVERPA